MGANKYYEPLQVQGRDFRMEAVLDHFNERIRVDLYTGNLSAVLQETEELAERYHYTKLIVKARHEHLSACLQHGYTLEAVIPGYFQGGTACLVTKYRSAERRNSMVWMQEETILSSILGNDVLKRKHVPAAYRLRKAGHEDAPRLAELYGKVFQVYPTPLNQQEYVWATMDEGTLYYVYEQNGQIVSAASAEVDPFQRNAELTNCATLEEHRAYGLVKELLVQLEEDLRTDGIYCAYTIARALSYGMNAAFRQLGYTYTGRLVNNCYIFDKLEDMNVWAKDLSQ
ncbi:putative beta-lysine N-acetyltransferase [Ectobacillus ponti]|uniref:Beta-lysine N-acetyltransferase n=1 Tax=Ectobacillus ponti TaxID=2961894 RepID=A0AA41XDA7_9BACI|nr:putative beta-lysine N-acetyltransferase [Ectobacillus ponti]MCP8970763.1 putative beta-lysine N-acetyltransferase [Ectobacillus ponti]